MLRDVAFTLVRFFAFTAHALLLGIPVICLIVLRPAFAGVDGEVWRAARTRVAQRLEGAARAALVASAVASAIGILLQAILIASLDEGNLAGPAFSSVFGTTFGQWYLFRFPLLAGLYVLLAGQIALRALEKQMSRAWWAGWIALTGVLLSTSTFTGHAAVSEPRAAGIVNDLVHLTAGSIWFSGIVLLAVFLPDAWRGRSEAERVQLLAPIVVRFSFVALVTITIVAITGTLNSFLNVAAFGDLLGSAYGVTLVLKIALFVGILGMGAVNHFVLRERMRKAADVQRSSSAHATFGKTIAVELVIAIAIMGATGLLTGQAKTRQPGMPPSTEVTAGS